MAWHFIAGWRDGTEHELELRLFEILARVLDTSRLQCIARHSQADPRTIRPRWLAKRRVRTANRRRIVAARRNVRPRRWRLRCNGGRLVAQTLECGMQRPGIACSGAW